MIPLDTGTFKADNERGGDPMLSIRTAHADDAQLISRIFAASWREAYQGLISADYLLRLPDGYWVPSIRPWLSSGQVYGLIAQDGDDAVGAILFGRGRDPEWGGCGEIVSLYVLPDSMHRGVGSMLLHQALQALREEGYRRMYLWALEGNRVGDAFYRKHGFRLTADRIPYHIGGKAVTDVRYVLD